MSPTKSHILLFSFLTFTLFLLCYSGIVSAQPIPTENQQTLEKSEEQKLYEAASKLSRERKYGEAAEKFRQLLKINPNHEEAKIGLAFVLTQMGNIEEADKILGLTPTTPSSPEKTPSEEPTPEKTEPGKVEEKGEKESVIEKVTKAIAKTAKKVKEEEIVPESEESKLYNTARKLASEKKYDEAIATYRELIKQNPHHSDAKVGLAYLLTWTGKSEEAETLFQEVLARRPDHGDALLGMGRIYARRKEYEKARELFEKVIEQHPKYTDAYVALGTMQAWQKDYDASIKTFEKAREIDPENSSPLLQLGKIYMWSNRYDEALKTFNLIIEKDPENLEAQMGIAKIYQRQGKEEESLAIYQKILEIDPDFVEARVQMGLLYAKTDRVDEASTELQRSLRLDEDNIGAYVALGRVMGWESKMDEAKELYFHALERDPKNVDALNGLANLYYREGEREKSEEYYRKALEYSPGNVDSLQGISKMLLAKAPVGTVRYKFSYSRNWSERRKEDAYRSWRNEVVTEVKAPVARNLSLQVRGLFARKWLREVEERDESYDLLQYAVGPRASAKFYSWLRGSGRYMLNIFENTPGTYSIKPLAKDDYFHAGYVLVRADSKYFYLIPSFSREYDYALRRPVEIIGYNDWRLSSGILITDYIEIINSATYRVYDDNDRDSREIYDVAGNFRLPWIPSIELGYEFSLADRPQERFHSPSIRWQGEPFPDFLVDAKITFSNEDAYTDDDYQEYLFELFWSWKIDRRYRLTFDGEYEFSSGSSKDDGGKFLVYLTAALGKISEATLELDKPAEKIGQRREIDPERRKTGAGRSKSAD
ncbi:tetratricopeptide repeat protein [Bdellovibrionota bacterium]